MYCIYSNKSMQVHIAIVHVYTSKHVAFLNMGKSSTCQNFKWNVFSKVYYLHSSQFQGLCLMKIFSKHTSKFVILLYESSNSNIWQILYCFSEKIFLSGRNPKIVRSDPTALECTHTHRWWCDINISDFICVTSHGMC